MRKWHGEDGLCSPKDDNIVRKNEDLCALRQNPSSVIKKRNRSMLRDNRGKRPILVKGIRAYDPEKMKFSVGS